MTYISNTVLTISMFQQKQQFAGFNFLLLLTKTDLFLFLFFFNALENSKTIFFHQKYTTLILFCFLESFDECLSGIKTKQRLHYHLNIPSMVYLYAQNSTQLKLICIAREIQIAQNTLWISFAKNEAQVIVRHFLLHCPSIVHNQFCCYVTSRNSSLILILRCYILPSSLIPLIAGTRQASLLPV